MSGIQSHVCVHIHAVGCPFLPLEPLQLPCEANNQPHFTGDPEATWEKPLLLVNLLSRVCVCVCVCVCVMPGIECTPGSCLHSITLTKERDSLGLDF
jgi:hypothetical protein